MSGSVAVFCLYPDDLTPVTREGEEKPHKQGYFFPRDSGKKHLHSHSCTVDRTVHVARVDDPTVVIVSGRLKGFLLPNLCSGSYQLSSLAAVSASAIMSSTPPPP
jgi:hypothetical protein